MNCVQYFLFPINKSINQLINQSTNVICYLFPGPVFINLQENPSYRFLVFAFCDFLCFEGCVALIFVPTIVAVVFNDPVRTKYITKLRYLYNFYIFILCFVVTCIVGHNSVWHQEWRYPIRFAKRKCELKNEKYLTHYGTSQEWPNAQRQRRE